MFIFVQLELFKSVSQSSWQEVLFWYHGPTQYLGVKINLSHVPQMGFWYVLGSLSKCLTINPATIAYNKKLCIHKVFPTVAWSEQGCQRAWPYNWAKISPWLIGSFCFFCFQTTRGHFLPGALKFIVVIITAIYYDSCVVCSRNEMLISFSRSRFNEFTF